MKKNFKKLCLLMAVLAMGAVTYANESIIAENNTQSIQQDEESLGGLAKDRSRHYYRWKIASRKTFEQEIWLSKIHQTVLKFRKTARDIF